MSVRDVLANVAFTFAYLDTPVSVESHLQPCWKFKRFLSSHPLELGSGCQRGAGLDSVDDGYFFHGNA